MYSNTNPTIYGGPAVSCCPPLFDLSCNDGSIGIFHTGGELEMAMRWFGLRAARSVRETVNFLQYMGGLRRTPGDTTMPGTPANICEPGDCATFGTPCTDVKECFGLLKICGDPVVDGGNSLPYCERDPRVTIGGESIANDEAWHEMNVTEATWNTFVYNLLWSYRLPSASGPIPANPFGHYGLWSLLHGFGDARDYVYPCPELAPKILDWAGNPACSPTPQAGITLNGQALADEYTTNIYDTLRSIFRALQRQISRTRGLMSGAFQYGDWAILGPQEAFDCLIECAVCFTECNNDFMQMDSERAAIRLQELREAGEGFGELRFDRFRVPLIPFDPTLITDDGTTVAELPGLRNADGTYNLLFLYRGSGNNRVLQPEFNPLSDGTWPTRDNGMVQLYMDTQDVCRKMGARLEWRWHKVGMSFSFIIKNIECAQILPNQLVQTFQRAETTCP